MGLYVGAYVSTGSMQVCGVQSGFYVRYCAVAWV